MLRVTIITIGVKAAKWINDGYNEYAKRLNKYCQLNLIELSTSQRSKNNSVEQLKKLDTQRIINKLKPNDTVIALDVQGKVVSTEQLSQLIDTTTHESSNITFIIGGPNGIDYNILQQDHKKISLSKLTFPHPLVRVILIEQLYRAFSIINNHPYHK